MIAKAIFLGFAACCIVAGIGAWVSIVYHMIRMACSRSNDAPLRWLTRYNRFNLIMYPSDLTEHGRVYRRRVFQSFIAFFGLWLLAGAAGIIAQLVKP
jgi:hypothetical protein